MYLFILRINCYILFKITVCIDSTFTNKFRTDTIVNLITNESFFKNSLIFNILFYKARNLIFQIKPHAYCLTWWGLQFFHSSVVSDQVLADMHITGIDIETEKAVWVHTETRHSDNYPSGPIGSDSAKLALCFLYPWPVCISPCSTFVDFCQISIDACGWECTLRLAVEL